VNVCCRLQASEVRAHRDIANLYKQKAQWHKALASLKSAHKLVVRMRAQTKGTFVNGRRASYALCAS
jgi:hypothetical protein